MGKEIKKIVVKGKEAKGVQTGKGQKGLMTNAVKKRQSNESTFTISNVVPQEEDMGSRLSPLVGTDLAQNMSIYDTCAYVFHCETHGKVAVGKNLRAVWLPFIALPVKRSWSSGAIDGANLILSGQNPSTFVKFKNKWPFLNPQCMQLFRLQLPQTQKFVTRLIYYIKIDPKNESFKCCQNSSTFEWLALNDVKYGKVVHLWGPELVEYVRRIAVKVEHNVHEYSLDEAFKYVPRDPPRNLEEVLLRSCGITEKDIERVYLDFIEHCFPSFFMTKDSFRDYMSKYGFEKNDSRLSRLFNAFNYIVTGFLSFHELLIGLAAIEPGGATAQSRVNIIFRYYDVDNDALLNHLEFTNLCQDIHRKLKGKDLDSKVSEGKRAIGVKNNGIAYDSFIKAVGSQKFRGTSSLCRSSKHIFIQISRAMANRTLKKVVGKQSIASIVTDRKYEGKCQSCLEKRFELTTHSVKLTDKGWADPIKLGISVGTESGNQEFSLRRHSVEQVFNPQSVANYFLQQIRAFNATKGTVNDYKGLGESGLEQFMKQLSLLCSEVRKIVEKEDRCVQLCSPAYIVGDLHGNLEDLLSIEKCLWKSIPLVSSNYVFLGDYVDRGKWGLECALYVFALKLMAPNKVVILRGNHEERTLNAQYSFKKECLKKYGQLGNKVWEVTNQVFDCLPVCAVIDDSIYCAHGGIPAVTRDVNQINKKVKSNLRDPQKESDIAWQILWSDPCRPQRFSELSDQFPHLKSGTPKGFLQNDKRGTAYLYGEEALNQFLQNNGLTHVVRAHEVPADGYVFHFGNKCTTIFSCSHYCGNNNNAACVHVSDGKLRIVRIDTVNNAPATDSH